jgi:hypothetical protein
MSTFTIVNHGRYFMFAPSLPVVVAAFLFAVQALYLPVYLQGYAMQTYAPGAE